MGMECEFSEQIVRVFHLILSLKEPNNAVNKITLLKMPVCVCFIEANLKFDPMQWLASFNTEMKWWATHGHFATDVKASASMPQ